MPLGEVGPFGLSYLVYVVHVEVDHDQVVVHLAFEPTSLEGSIPHSLQGLSYTALSYGLSSGLNVGLSGSAFLL